MAKERGDGMFEGERYSFDWMLERIKSCDASEHNKKKVLLFIKTLQMQNISIHSLAHYMRVLYSLLVFTSKVAHEKIEDLDEDLLIAFFDWLKPVKIIRRKRRDGKIVIKEKPVKGDFAPGSKWLYMQYVKRFYCWLLKKEKPRNCMWMRKPRGIETSITERDILTPEEIRKMIDTADNLRTKALIHCLYETGCRAGEFLGMNIGDIEVKKGYARAQVDGKTGKRYVYFIKSWILLHEWIEQHPYKNNPSAPLWISLSSRNYGQRLGLSSLGKILKTVAKRAGIERNVFPHLFRHTSVSHRIMEGYSEEVLKKIYGWTRGSNMLAMVYGHISSGDVERFIAKKEGLIKEEEKRSEALEPVECPRCHTVHPPGTKICGQCNFILDVKTAMELESEEQIWSTALVNLLREKPEIAEMLALKKIELEAKQKIPPEVAQLQAVLSQRTKSHQGQHKKGAVS